MTIEEFIRAVEQLAQSLDLPFSQVEIGIDLRRKGLGQGYYIMGTNVDMDR